MATPTTMIVPMPNEEKIGLPEKNMPAIAAITVNPEISTARPEVAAAMSSAAAGRAALVLLLHHPAEVEHRVVDADRQADEHRDLADGLVQRAELADRAEQAGGGHERARCRARSGTPAATAAPKASSRISSVPPIENCIDLASSARSEAPSAFCADASPYSSTRSSG